MASTGTKALDSSGSMVSGMRGCWRLGVGAHQADADRDPRQREADQGHQPGRRQPLDRRGVRAEAHGEPDGQDQHQGQHRLDHTADDVADQHGAREIAMVRNRAMMPSVMSVATDTAVPREIMPTVISRMPGTM